MEARTKGMGNVRAGEEGVCLKSQSREPRRDPEKGVALGPCNPVDVLLLGLAPAAVIQETVLRKLEVAEGPTKRVVRCPRVAADDLPWDSNRPDPAAADSEPSARRVEERGREGGGRLKGSPEFQGGHPEASP